MPAAAPILDSAVVAAFGAGTLTPDQAEAILPRDRATAIFFLLQLRTGRRCPHAHRRRPAVRQAGGHAPAEEARRRDRPPRRRTYPARARRPPRVAPTPLLSRLRRRTHPHRTHPHPPRRGHPRRPEARSHRAHDPPRLVPVLQEAGRAPGARRPPQLYPRQPHRRPVGLAPRRAGRHHPADRRRVQRPPAPPDHRRRPDPDVAPLRGRAGDGLLGGVRRGRAGQAEVLAAPAAGVDAGGRGAGRGRRLAGGCGGSSATPCGWN